METAPPERTAPSPQVALDRLEADPDAVAPVAAAGVLAPMVAFALFLTPAPVVGVDHHAPFGLIGVVVVAHVPAIAAVVADDLGLGRRGAERKAAGGDRGDHGEFHRSSHGVSLLPVGVKTAEER